MERIVEVDLVEQSRPKKIPIDNNLSMAKKNVIRKKNRIIKNQQRERLRFIFDMMLDIVKESTKVGSHVHVSDNRDSWFQGKFIYEEALASEEEEELERANEQIRQMDEDED